MNRRQRPSAAAPARPTVARAVALLAAAAALAACGSPRAVDAAAAAPDGAGVCGPAVLADIVLDGAAATSAEPVAAGRYSPPGGGALDDLPPFCRITGVATPSTDSAIHFEVWMPQRRHWNGKLVVTGNGGFNPALSYGDMAYALRQGYAAVGGDTGHAAADGPGLAWGVGHPEKIVDWGRRSIHAIVVPGARIVEALQGRSVSRRYFYGCSTGGSQAYGATQAYPQDFDGVIAGAPANNRVRLSAEFLWRYRAGRSPAPGHDEVLTADAAKLLQQAAVAACDALDGTADGIIDDPRVCITDRFDPAALRCLGAASPACLTAAQVAAAQRLYQGARNPRTAEQIYPGPLPGTEVGWPGYWRESVTRFDFWRLWVFADPAWDPWRFDFDVDLAAALARLGPTIDHLDADLAAFKARSGKLITYQGWADPVINAQDTIAYHEQVRAAQGSLGATDAFFRLFVVPGMGHCGGGPGANVFGNAGTAAPVVNAETDLLMALDRWVEGGVAPQRLVAAEVRDGAVVRTRALCPYPLRAVYSGAGSRNEAANFRCR